jgi:hypothetical protein
MTPPPVSPGDFCFRAANHLLLQIINVTTDAPMIFEVKHASLEARAGTGKYAYRQSP